MLFTKTIKSNFGSKKGLLRYWIANIKHAFGIYESCKKIDFSQVDRLIFVCSGNICRSPLAEAVAKFHGIKSESYGLDTRGGDSADSRAIAYAESHSINLAAHVTKKIDEYLPQQGDLIIGMEPRHLLLLRARYDNRVPMTLAGFWSEKVIVYIHDPYNTNADFFKYCSDIVFNSAKNIARRIKSNTQ